MLNGVVRVEPRDDRTDVFIKEEEIPESFLSLPCEDTVRRKLSTSLEQSPHQKPNFSTP